MSKHVTISKYSTGIEQRSGNFQEMLIPEDEAANIMKNNSYKTVRVSVKQMKILEIFPNPQKIILVASYGTVSGEPIRMNYPNTGLLSIYNKLNKYLKYDCRYFDPNIADTDFFYQILRKEHIDLVGFSILNTTLHNDIELISMTKQISPTTTIVIGGPTIKTFSEEIFKYIPLDHLVIGDGFNGINEILSGNKHSQIIEAKENNRYFVDTKIFFKDSANDVVNRRSYFSPSTTSHLPYNCVGNLPMRIRLSQKCGGRCTYCNIPRIKTIKNNIVKTIKSIDTHKELHDSIEFEDHEFTFNQEMVNKLCQGIIVNDLSYIPKQCCTRVDSIQNELLQIMKESGMRIINYGIESFDQGILDFFNKDVSVRQNIDAIESTLAHDIKPGINLILFSPLETELSIKETVKHASYFALQGATINAVLKVTVCYGDRANRLKSHQPHIKYSDFFYPGMLQSWALPKSLKVSPSLYSLYKEVIEFSKKFSREYEETYRRYPSVALNSFAIIFGIASILALPEQSILNKLIKLVINAEENRSIWIDKCNNYNKY